MQNLSPPLKIQIMGLAKVYDPTTYCSQLLLELQQKVCNVASAKAHTMHNEA